LGIDDLFITIGWALGVVCNGLILLCMSKFSFVLHFVEVQNLTLDLVAYRYGLDRHMWDVPVVYWEKGVFVSLNIDI
jgi:hypothetical protein